MCCDGRDVFWRVVDRRLRLPMCRRLDRHSVDDIAAGVGWVLCGCVQGRRTADVRRDSLCKVGGGWVAQQTGVFY
jgi:hypothetical protein|eukprot:scaffold6912_cov197-Alexandrium_tamarense.AAC.9